MRAELILTSPRADQERPGPLGDVDVIPLDSLQTGRQVPAVEGDQRSRVAYMIYTSGTTGTPKGVQIGNAAFAAAVDSTRSHWLQSSHEDPLRFPVSL